MAWGAGNGTNLSGNFLNSEQGQSIVPAVLSNVIAIAAGGHRSLALRADGSIIGWGDNFFGQGTTPPGVSNVTAIAAGVFHTLAIREGRQLPIIMQHPADQAAPAGSNVTFTAKGLGLAGVKYQWQFNGTNIVGATNATLTLNNVQASSEGSYRVIISTGAGSFTSSSATFILITPPVLVSQTQPDWHWVRPDGALVLSVNATGPFLTYQWKSNGTIIPILDWPAYYVPFFDSAEERQYQVVVTNAAASTNSTIWKVRSYQPGGIAVWGDNTDGECNRPSGLTSIIGICAGHEHVTALKEDTTVIAWGGNAFGQTNLPSGLSNVIAVAAGSEHTLALKENGTLVTWGRTDYGLSNIPADCTNAVKIAAGGVHNLVLLSNGTLRVWGTNYGTMPASATNVTAIASGLNFDLAVRSNGTVVAWGGNEYGQTSVPVSATNVVAIAAGDYHALALKQNGQVVAWGYNASGQINVPADLTNAMAVAAGSGISLALCNDGTLRIWGDNTFGEIDKANGLQGLKLIAAGGNTAVASAFSSCLQYQVEVSQDLLLIYNSSSTNSIVVKDYYLAHRPMVSNANVLGISCPTNEIITPSSFTNQILEPYLDWLDQNPTKRPQYLIAFLDIPSRVHDTTNVYDSVFNQLHTKSPSHRPFVMTINMNGTNDCRAYIDKLRFFGTNYSPGKLIISAGAANYGNTNYVVDNVRHDDYQSEYSASFVRAATNGLLSAGVPAQSILYAEDIEPCINGLLGRDADFVCTNGYQAKIHLTNAVDVAGYISWGFHSSLEVWTPERVSWTGNSCWWLIETIESFNGVRSIYDGLDGLFLRWFTSSSFGGTNYSNTPVGGVTHVDEPQLPGVNDASLYFGLWANGKSFAISAWNSRRTGRFQAVGDPFVVK